MTNNKIDWNELREAYNKTYNESFRDIEDLFICLNKDMHMSRRKIADILGVSESATASRTRHLNLYLRHRGKRIDWDKIVCRLCYNNLYSMLFDLYVIEELGLFKISDLINVSYMTIKVKLIELGIRVRGRGGYNFNNRTRNRRTMYAS